MSPRLIGLLAGIHQVFDARRFQIGIEIEIGTGSLGSVAQNFSMSLDSREMPQPNIDCLTRQNCRWLLCSFRFGPQLRLGVVRKWEVEVLHG